jgi:hypothetical protein
MSGREFEEVFEWVDGAFEMAVGYMNESPWLVSAGLEEVHRTTLLGQFTFRFRDGYNTRR